MDSIDSPVLVELAVILAIAAGLHVALGPIVARLIEALKPSGLVRDNYAGLAAILLSAILGGALGLLAMLNPESGGEGDWRFVAYGIIAGILGPGSGAVTSAQVRQGIQHAKDERATEKFVEEEKQANREASDRLANGAAMAPMRGPYNTPPARLRHTEERTPHWDPDAGDWDRGTTPTYGVDEDHSHDAIDPDDGDDASDAVEDVDDDRGAWILRSYQAEERRLENGLDDTDVDDVVDDPDAGPIPSKIYYGGGPTREE